MSRFERDIILQTKTHEAKEGKFLSLSSYAF